jgi:hypothetical protein
MHKRLDFNYLTQEPSNIMSRLAFKHDWLFMRNILNFMVYKFLKNQLIFNRKHISLYYYNFSQKMSFSKKIKSFEQQKH